MLILEMLVIVKRKLNFQNNIKNINNIKSRFETRKGNASSLLFINASFTPFIRAARIKKVAAALSD
jgi:hypothetical protein